MSIISPSDSVFASAVAVSPQRRTLYDAEIIEQSRDTARHRDASMRAGRGAGRAPLVAVLAGTPDQFQTGPQHRLGEGGLYRHGAKRALDLLILLLAMPIALPLIAILAVLVSADGGRPFYTQERIGRHGRTYRIWKLRSMVVDADERLQACLQGDPAMRSEWESKQKLINDPRITRLGRVLRKCSMDELPQLFNVLKGEMSLVGPRPMMPSQQAMYDGDAYYQLRPGITGLWQVSDRNDSSFGERARFDNDYNRKLSLKSDLAILAATFRVVLRGTGH